MRYVFAILFVSFMVWLAIPQDNTKSSTLKLETTLIGSFTATAYRSVPEQTKPKGYYWTASGERVHPHGLAVSQDLLVKNGGPLSFGDVVFVEGAGIKIVNDVMNKRHKHRIDIWVKTYDEEKDFDERIKASKLQVWIIHPILKEN